MEGSLLLPTLFNGFSIYAEILRLKELPELQVLEALNLWHKIYYLLIILKFLKFPDLSVNLKK